jgi:hypothetical protein
MIGLIEIDGGSKEFYHRGEEMSQADKIREFAYREYIKPARDKSHQEVTIRAGDVHKKMGLVDRMPAVTSAIGSVIFQKKYHIRLINREGPTNGANVYFTFLIESIV